MQLTMVIHKPIMPPVALWVYATKTDQRFAQFVRVKNEGFI
jgi:hypothetical protein